MKSISERIAWWGCTAVGSLPLSLRRGIGRLLGVAIAALPTHERRVARLQLRRFISERANEKRIIRSMYANFGETIMESLNLEPLLTSPSCSIVCPNLKDLPTWRDTDQPIVALTAHTGNWDLLGAYMAREGFRLTVAARPLRSALFQSILERLRSRAGLRTVWRSDRAGMRTLVSELTHGGVVAALIDQDTRVTSQLIPFFGVPARTPSSLVELAKRYRALIVTVFIIREGRGRYRIELEPIERETTVSEALAVFNRRLEGIIRRDPAQWVWFHKRWRADASGRRRSSKEYLEWLSLSEPEVRHAA